MEKHPQWAIKAAEIITGDNYQNPSQKHETNYGTKTIIGITDIIVNELDLDKICLTLDWLVCNANDEIIETHLEEVLKKLRQ